MQPLIYDHYFTFEELTTALKQLTASYPQFSRLSDVGISPEGRQLWLLTLTDFNTGKPENKPAYYIDGNFHAGEVTGSMVALYTAEALLQRSHEEATARLLQEVTFYIIPRVSPDGAEVYLTTPAGLRSVPRAYPEPEQQPGLVAEDINGDGHILLMRQKSRYGDWKVSSLDPRLMERRRPDEWDGVFYRVYHEGRLEQAEVLEGDLQPAPSIWSMDLNRNFPCSWDVEAKQAGAGVYPLSEPETKAVADFILTHPNIGYVSTLHTTGGALLRLPGIKPEKLAPKQDIEIFKAIGDMAAEETGYFSINVFNEFFADPAMVLSGAFDDWLYCNLGIPAHTIELWDLANRAGITNIYPRKEKSETELLQDNLKILQWNDRMLQGKGFVNWAVHQHPQLGEVEIGGFLTKTVLQNCPPEFLAAECSKVCNFLVRNAKTLPKLWLESFACTTVDANTWRVEIKVGNIGYLPTNLTAEALTLKTAKEVIAELKGASLADHKPALRKLGHLAGRVGRSGRFLDGGFRGRVDADCSKKVTWLIHGQVGDTCQIEISCPTAGLIHHQWQLEK
jgi:murein tripeptide amidase MpaA